MNISISSNSTETSNTCEIKMFGFFDLLNHLRGLVHFNVSPLYLKNIEMLKESLKIERRMPDFDQIEIFFKDVFLSK